MFKNFIVTTLVIYSAQSLAIDVETFLKIKDDLILYRGEVVVSNNTSDNEGQILIWGEAAINLFRKLDVPLETDEIVCDNHESSKKQIVQVKHGEHYSCFVDVAFCDDSEKKFPALCILGLDLDIGKVKELRTLK